MAAQTDTSQNSAQDQNLPQAELALDTSKNEAQSGKTLVSSQRNSRSQVSKMLNEVLESPQGKTIASGLLTATVVVLLITVAIVPALSSITTQIKRNEVLRDRNEEMEAKIENLLTLQSQEQQNATSLSEFNALLGERLYQDDIYSFMFDRTQSLGLVFQSLSFDIGDADSANIDTINESGTTSGEILPPELQLQVVNLQVKGQPDNIIQLIRTLESDKRIYDITSISITEDEDNAGNEDIAQSERLVANISMTTLYWDLGEEPISF